MCDKETDIKVIFWYFSMYLAVPLLVELVEILDIEYESFLYSVLSTCETLNCCYGVTDTNKAKPV